LCVLDVFDVADGDLELSILIVDELRLDLFELVAKLLRWLSFTLEK